jgi:2-polyprenyl-3-methyl-5-hydroxy-6-metoxy-1,4-benzoquinol methylase
MICQICGSQSFGILYRGLIRLGQFGDWSPEEHTVYRCLECLAGFLSLEGFDYESPDYREQVDGSAAIEDYYRLHDHDQMEKLSMLGTQGLRGLVVADVGCGGGSFLDLLVGLAQETIAIEPARLYAASLSRRHRYFPYCGDALPDYSGKIDLAVCFEVLEHVADPPRLLREIRDLLKPGGRLFLSTPNYDDWLVSFLPGVYDRFFFRRAHTWYFNGPSLENLATKSGFSAVTLTYKHRYDLSNALHWLRDHRPTGCQKTTLFSGLDRAFQQYLEEQAKADHLYACLWK